ncbi:type II toxin-antitoxin system PemK/MazF family toxin [Streptomyces sp. NBC_00525]|nr:type II toxin-antitoxin system PemK/MazF family toxin [Streptomyces sp. NBC_00525]
MQRGEVRWVDFDERRPVVLLSDEEPTGFQAMQVVAPAGGDMSDLGVEVPVGPAEGLSFEGVLRFAFPRPGLAPCTWQTTVARENLTEQAGVLSAKKLSEVDAALRTAGQEAVDPADGCQIQRTQRSSPSGRGRERARSRESLAVAHQGQGCLEASHGPSITALSGRPRVPS